jgi:hypothetical protein
VSRGSRLEALDALLGTASARGAVVRSRRGVYTDGDGLDPTDSIEDLVHASTGGDAICTNHKHGRLKGKVRCPGCGRTRNEVEIEGG